MPARKVVSPVLADLSQDIAGPIPVDLILLWNTRGKSKKQQQKLLDPYVKTGTIVSSDSSGLSKLTASKPLLTVMQLVSQPKEVIYAYGKYLGGEAIGTWIADNTQMFYDQKIAVQDVVEQMIAAQREIGGLTVQVGIGIHHTTAWEIGGGLYGEEASKIEEATENYISGKDLLVSNTVKKELNSRYHEKLTVHPDFPWSYLLNYADLVMSKSKYPDTNYPCPFDRTFFELLKNSNLDDPKIYQKIYTRYASDKIVVLMKIHHTESELLLNQLTDRVVANALIKKSAGDYQVQLVNSNGDVGIFITVDANEAVQFAQAIRLKLRQQKFNCTIGISKGEVLLFPLQNTGLQIAGGPVNIASKLAEDAGEKGEIFIEDSVAVKPEDAGKFTVEVSHIKIKGVKI